jgi:hypothetical protein
MSYTVKTLSVHEPGGETICWKRGQEDERRRALQLSDPTSELTAWFHLNQHDEQARQYTFLELPQYYLWNHSKKRWTKRRRIRKTIARIFPVMPRFAEKFAIRMLVISVRGPTSFEELRTLDDGTLCETFTQAAKVNLTIVLVYLNKVMPCYGNESTGFRLEA